MRIGFPESKVLKKQKDKLFSNQTCETIRDIFRISMPTIIYILLLVFSIIIYFGISYHHVETQTIILNITKFTVLFPLAYLKMLEQYKIKSS